MDRRTVGAATLAAGLAGVIYACAVRPWHLRWGATDDEVDAVLPGDELTPEPAGQSTHAITIRANPEDIWPWLAQIGQNRGGFYSYAWLENLVGCGLRNADRIVPEWQNVRPGAVVWLHPKAPPLPVVLVESGRCLVLGSNDAVPGTWGFYLRPAGDGVTRFLIRSRTRPRDRTPLGWVGYHGLFEPAHFIMEQRMMRTLKERAEESAGVSPGGVGGGHPSPKV